MTTRGDKKHLDHVTSVTVQIACRAEVQDSPPEDIPECVVSPDRVQRMVFHRDGARGQMYNIVYPNFRGSLGGNRPGFSHPWDGRCVCMMTLKRFAPSSDAVWPVLAAWRDETNRLPPQRPGSARPPGV